MIDALEKAEEESGTKAATWDNTKLFETLAAIKKERV